MYIVIKVKNKRGKIRMDKNVEILHTHTHTHTHTGTLAKNIKNILIYIKDRNICSILTNIVSVPNFAVFCFCLKHKVRI